MASHPPNVVPGPSNGQQGHPCAHGPTYVWVSPFPVLMCATFAGRAWTALAPMAYTAVGALAVIPATQQLMRSSREPWCQQRLLCIWSKRGFAQQTENSRMVLLSRLGTGVVSSSGMSPARISLHLPISSWQSENREPWLVKRSAGSQRSMQS